jgi:hypothetical protein
MSQKIVKECNCVLSPVLIKAYMAHLWKGNKTNIQRKKKLYNYKIWKKHLVIIQMTNSTCLYHLTLQSKGTKFVHFLVVPSMINGSSKICYSIASLSAPWHAV